MNTIGCKIGEIKVVMPGEQLLVWLAVDGIVHVQGGSGGKDVPLSETKWFMDRLRGAREGIRNGRSPSGWLLCCEGSGERIANNPFYLKMLQAARDVVRHAEQQSYRDQPADPNEILKGHGLPYRVRL